MKKISSFGWLNASQSLVTLNDSIFRLLVAYSLIDVLGQAKSNEILSLSALLFVLPFLVFSYTAGQFADRYSKRGLIMVTLWAELAFMLIGLFAVWMQHVFLSYLALFLVALQSSVFNPCKYAIIPEIEPNDRIARVNGYMTLVTYLSIILGTFLASFISDISGKNFTLVAFVCVIFSVIAIFTGLKIQKTPAQVPHKKIHFFFFKDMWHSLKIAAQYPHLLMAIFTSSYFLFTAGYTQLNLIPFGVQSLGITDIETGYVYLAAALGLGVGSMLVSIWSGKGVELGLSLWGGIGTSISYLLLFIFQHHLVIVCFIFFSIGMHGGLYVVPLDAYIQYASPDESRGSIVAVGSFMSFVGVLLSSVFLYITGEVLGMKAADGFFIIFISTFVVFIYMLFSFPEYIPRLLAVIYAKSFYTIHTTDEDIPGFFVATQKDWIAKFSLLLKFQNMTFLQVYRRPPNRQERLKRLLFSTITVPQDMDGYEHILRGDIEKAKMRKGKFCLFVHDIAKDERMIQKVRFMLQEEPVKVQFHVVAKPDFSFFHVLRALSEEISMNFEKMS